MVSFFEPDLCVEKGMQIPFSFTQGECMNLKKGINYLQRQGLSIKQIKLIFPEVRSLRTFYRWRSGNYSVDGREIQKMEMEMTKLVDGYKELKKQIF